MAIGDWAAGTSARPRIVNVTFTPSGALDRVELRFELFTPSGEYIKESTWDWAPSADGIQQIQSMGQTLLTDFLTTEGFALWSLPVKASLPA